MFIFIFFLSYLLYDYFRFFMKCLQRLFFLTFFLFSVIILFTFLLYLLIAHIIFSFSSLFFLGFFDLHFFYFGDHFNFGAFFRLIEHVFTADVLYSLYFIYQSPSLFYTNCSL